MRLSIALFFAVAAGVASAQGFQLQSRSLLTVQGSTLTMYSTSGALLARSVLNREYADVAMVGERLYGLAFERGTTGNPSFARVYQIDTESGGTALAFAKTYDYNAIFQRSAFGLGTIGDSLILEQGVSYRGANDSHGTIYNKSGGYLGEVDLGAYSQGVDAVGARIFNVDRLAMEGGEITYRDYPSGANGRHDLGAGGVYQGMAGAEDRYWVSRREHAGSTTATLNAYDFNGVFLSSFAIDAPINGMAHVGAVPEPGTLAALGLGAFLVGRKRAKR